MDNEKLMEILRNFTEKQVNELPEKGKMVFYAIMDIADERDELKDRINKAIELVDKLGEYEASDEYMKHKGYLVYNKLEKVLKGEYNE